jgi:hypothetical protein
MGTIDVGALLYEYTVKFTGMTEYGVSFEALMAGTTLPPPEGARFDVPFEGASNGPKLKGRVTGSTTCESGPTVDSTCIFMQRSRRTTGRRSPSTPMALLFRSPAVRSPACART